MNHTQNVIAVISMAVLSGCATLPPGPSVTVFPPKEKSFETFRSEDANCRQWAGQQTGMSSQQAYDSNLASGAVAGTAIGAGVGAALGSASGNTGAGVLLGAASGLFVGSAVGSESGRVYGREAQRRYDNTYLQCMYSYGNQVPGYRLQPASAPPLAVGPQSPPMASPEPDYSPAPPEISYDEAPRFIYSQPLNMYVAVGIPYDLLYNGSEYFYFYGGRWYRGPYYNGPWAFAPRRSYPAVFLRYRIGNIRQYRDAEFGRYERDRERFNGRIHRPEYRGEARRTFHREERR